MAVSRNTRLLAWIGIPLILIGVLAAIWNWDWFIPMVESRASASLGRPVIIAHLHVGLGRVVTVSADQVVVTNPKDWPKDDPPLAQIGRLTTQVDVLGYLTGHGLVLPLIQVDKPQVYAAETKDGAANFHISTGGGGGGSSMKIRELRINEGNAHVVIPRMKSDFTAQVATQEDKINVDANGMYAAQPITAKLVGGALLSLRDPNNPWPIDLNLANGPTRVAIQGTLQDPLALKGANVRLRANGPDMGLLEPLVGLPIPKTPPFQIASKVDFEGFTKIRLDDFQGRLGASDIAGTIAVSPGNERPVVDMNLRSNRVDLTDLGGVIGAKPGHTAQEAKPAGANDKLLPDTPVSIPRLTWADIHLRYHGAHIAGRNMPLDDVTVVADVVDGQARVHPMSFGVGKGRLIGNMDLAPTSGKNVHARLDLQMQNLDVSRMMAATHTFEGAGSVSGVGAIDATGSSLASLMANGNGQVKMAMAGGDLSAVLVDLTGLHFGNALLSALGVPNKTPVKCFVSDMALKHGVLDFNVMTLDTGEAIVNVGGNVNLAKETIDLGLKTDAKHFSVGSLPTRIAIGGTFKNPTIRPGAEAAARAGAAVGLAVLFAPLAILPTVQFGTSDEEDARCGELLQQARAGAGGKALPAAPR